MADAEDGAHLVGHSYGGLGAMLAAARRPAATLSLTLLEPAAAADAEQDESWRTLVADVGEMWKQDLAELAAARFPKLVVSGGHHCGFDAMCRDLALRIGGSCAIVPGAGHEIQFVGETLNQLLLDLWESAPRSQ